MIVSLYGKHRNRNKEKSKREQFQRSASFFTPDPGVRHHPQNKRGSLQRATRIQTQDKKKRAQENGSQERNRALKKTRQNGHEIESCISKN